MFDANLNKQSDLGRAYDVSFLWGTDAFIDSSSPRRLDVKWGNAEGRAAELEVPPSRTLRCGCPSLESTCRTANGSVRATAHTAVSATRRPTVAFAPTPH